MPISGLVIRLKCQAGAAELRVRARTLGCLELGAARDSAIAGVIDAPDYAAHDATLETLREQAEVSSVDIVFHDFSDVNEFPKLPRRQRMSR